VKQQQRPSDALLYSLIACMVFFWSLNFIVGKVALREFPPLLLAGLRTQFAGLMILPVYLVRARRDPSLTWSRTDLPVLLYLGLFGVALNQLFFVLGLSRTSVAHSSILVGTTPMQVLLIAGMTGLERITPWKVGGMLVALSGIAVLNTTPQNGAHPTLVGDVLAFVASTTFALFVVIGKRVTTRYRGLTVSTFAWVGGGLMLLPVTIWQSAGFSYSQVSPAAWLSVLYMALFPSVIAYLIFYFALTHILATRVSSFSYLQPLIATLMAIPLLGEPVTLGIAAGGALVFLGVYVTERT
jgi:drug/metabolite transporter (DMT)-like permease